MISNPPKTFGSTLRQLRQEREVTLRKFAELVGLSPGYLSQVESDDCIPPTVERLQKMARILRVNADALIALAGRLPADLPGIIQAQPVLMARLLRAASGLTGEQLDALKEMARSLKNKEGDRDGAESLSCGNCCTHPT
jgi:HTH-type transcriptional regulator, competence development regulator